MAVLNDFEANGYGVTALQPEHVVVLNDVPPMPKVPLTPASCNALSQSPLSDVSQHGTFLCKHLMASSGGSQQVSAPPVRRKTSGVCMEADLNVAPAP